MTPRRVSGLLLLALAQAVNVACFATAGAEPAPPLQERRAVIHVRAEPAASTPSRPARKCRDNEETYRVLKLTPIDGGVRVDYEFVTSGRVTWTNMNRPMLKQFSVTAAGGTFCLPRDTYSTENEDYDFD